MPYFQYQLNNTNIEYFEYLTIIDLNVFNCVWGRHSRSHLGWVV